MSMDVVNHSDDSDTVCEYEEVRKKNEMAKLKLLREMGLLLGNKMPTIPLKVNKRKIKSENKGKLHNAKLISKEPVRKSPRLSKISMKNCSLDESKWEIKEEPQLQREFFKGPEAMNPVFVDAGEEDVKPSLQNLVHFCSEVPNVNATGIKLSLNDFKKSLKNYSLVSDDVKKVGTTKTYSLVIHPSESKLLIITGDGVGYLSFWDVNNSGSGVEIYRPHRNPIYCLSVCSFNPLKLYATSVDGVVRSCDIEKMEFNDIYVTKPPDHTVYHAQQSPHTLLVAHGCGNVGLVDMRISKNPSQWIECHRKSVRTVHQNPVNEHEFVTASGVGEVGMWDVRKTKKQSPLMLLPHPKSMKSAFYSPEGSMLLTTCNDHKIRIYSATGNVLITSNSLNLHAGRWLRPLTAVWHPIRNDAFIIGSMNRPREVNIFGIHGLPLHTLKSPHLTTVLSNSRFHQTLPVIVGANSSGYVHVFRGICCM